MELKEAIFNRRTIRDFKRKDVIDGKIADLLECALWSPSAGNSQETIFIVVKEKPRIVKISDACYKQHWISHAPAVIVVACVMDKLERPFGDRALSYAYQDAALAAYSILLRAADLGLGAAYVGFFDEDKIRNITSLPDDTKPIVVIPLGYPDRVPPAPYRYLLWKRLHVEHYGKRWTKLVPHYLGPKYDMIGREER